MLATHFVGTNALLATTVLVDTNALLATICFYRIRLLCPDTFHQLLVLLILLSNLGRILANTMLL